MSNIFHSNWSTFSHFYFSRRASWINSNWTL